MAADDELDAGAPGGGSNKMLPVIIGVVALVAGGAGGYFASSAMSAEPGQDAKEAAAIEGAQGVPAAAEANSAVTSLGSFTVNLRDSAGGRLLQMDISVEADSAATAAIPARQAQIRDATIMLASDYSYLELEGLDGKMRLRDEIQRRINAVLQPMKVDRVYFTSFVVQ